MLPPFSSLMSPPESVKLGSFSPDSCTDPNKFALMKKAPEISFNPLSPPHSPWKTVKEAGSARDPHPQERDPILYNGHHPPSHHGDLFTSAEEERSAQEAASRHRAEQIRHRPDGSIPSIEEYLVALSCAPSISAAYNRGPQKYLKRALEDTEENYKYAQRIGAAPYVRKLDGPSAKRQHAMPRSRVATQGAPKPRPVAIRKQATIRQQTPFRSPATGVFATFSPRTKASTPDGTPRAKRPEDTDFASLADYAPPTETLGSDPRALRVDGLSTNALDLSADPDRHLLHPAEVLLAQTLRLSCATYLCSKRRIFIARVESLERGKEAFRKTDAQQACKIDVNKASKLHTAFEKVGWFDRQWFEETLQQRRKNAMPSGGLQ